MSDTLPERLREVSRGIFAKGQLYLYDTESLAGLLDDVATELDVSYGIIADLNATLMDRVDS